MRGCQGLAVVAIAGLATFVAVATAAPEPGSPLAVAPGVPSHGRAWELVTSPDPVSASVARVRAISAGGDRISYATVGQLPGSPGGEPLVAPEIATRGAGGWVNATDVPPFAEFDLEPAPVAVSPDFEGSIWKNQLSGGDVGLFRRVAGGAFTPAVSVGSTPGSGFLGASADLGHFIVASGKHLLAADASRTSGMSIYEVVGTTPRLVDIADDGTLLSDCGSTAGGPNSISDDGNRIFFSTSPGCSGPLRVFLREGGVSTTQVAIPQCAPPGCGPEANITFVGATPSGSAAFLVTAQRLSDADTDSRPDLYAYDVAGGGLTLISTSWEGRDLIPAAEPVRASVDGSRLYFGAVEQIGPGETSAPRLYMADAGGPRPVPGAVPGQFLQLAADGRYALFASAAQLVAGDTDGSVDVYRYDAADRSLTWISAGFPGGNGAFDAAVAPGPISSAMAAGYPYRTMSDDGGRVFFDTAERLLPADRNDGTDVYEWANGSLGLISSGAGGRESTYVDSTPDGASVLFRTADTLLPSDRDGGDWDLYVARIGGGFAEAPPPAACDGGACAAVPLGPLRRPVANSARPLGAADFRLRPIGAGERRRIAATGWIALLAEVPKAGDLSAEVRARIGRRELAVVAASVKVSRPGPATLRLRLAPEARRALAAGRSLRLQLRLRLSGLDAVRRAGFELGPER